MDNGTCLIILGKGFGFPNRSDNKLLKPYIYYDKNIDTVSKKFCNPLVTQAKKSSA